MNIYLKLGSNCNLSCKHCHLNKNTNNIHKSVSPALMNAINGLSPDTLVFCGGEPLLYINHIQYICENLIRSDTNMYLVSNCTLLNDHNISILNKYNIKVCPSYDGEHGCRDMSIYPCFSNLNRVRLAGMSTVYYNENKDLTELMYDIYNLKNTYHFDGNHKSIYDFFPNFAHETNDTGLFLKDGIEEDYIKDLTTLIEESIKEYIESGKQHVSHLLFKSFDKFVKVKSYESKIKCVPSCTHLTIDLDGNIYGCGYTTETYGTIYDLDSLDFKKIENSILPDKCKECSIKDVCKVDCYRCTTNKECYIMKSMNSNIKNLMDKYNITYNELTMR